MSTGDKDVLHEHGGPATRWTTVNMAEVLPGVLTPLGWTFWREPAEAGLRGAFYDAGALTKRQLPPPVEIDKRLTGLFFGRYAANLTVISALCDLIPGSSGESFEIQLFGRADTDVVRAKSMRRYPAVAARMPVNVAMLSSRLRRTRSEVDSWWRREVSAYTGDPVDRLDAARDRLRSSLRIHMMCSLVAQGCYEQLVRLADRAGTPGVELQVMTGYGGMEELQISADLWRVSRDTMTMPDFLVRHGYHGPGEGELSSRSWREDPTPVRELALAYRGMPEEQDPQLREAARAVVRADAEARLLSSLPRARRPAARIALRAARLFVPLREVGKVAFLQSIDAGRAAARDLGRNLSAAGRIPAPDDVFYLTWNELTTTLPADVADVVRRRRTVRETYQRQALPERWTGEPVPAPLDDGLSDLHGVPVCPGVVEGRARVITDPSSADGFEPGDILVCETTDPSWVVFFQLAAAVVIDVGGPLSHGAIVARELGLPAVINTRRATRLIPDGARIRVDGGTGEVTILDDGADPDPTRS